MNTKAKKILSVISVMLIICLLFAGCTPTAAEGETPSLTSTLLQTVLPIGLLVVVFYFFMIRPERKRKKETEEMRSSLSAGDPIVTIGGLTGRIVEMTDDSIVFETGEDRVRIEVKKWAISKKAK